MTTALFLVAAVSALTVGLGKGGLGAAFAGVITPILSIFMPVKEALALVLPFFIVGDWLAMRAYWKRWDTAQLKRLMPPGVVGVVIGTYLLVSLSTPTLRLLLGVITLVVAVYKIAEPYLRTMRYSYRNWHPYVAGTTAGIGSALASAGGPALSGYLLLIRMEPMPFIATTVFFFTVTNLLRIPGLVLDGVFEWEKFKYTVWLMPLVFICV